MLDGIVFAIAIICGFIVPTMAVNGSTIGYTMWNGLYISRTVIRKRIWDVMPLAIAALVSMLKLYSIYDELPKVKGPYKSSDTEELQQGYVYS